MREPRAGGRHAWERVRRARHDFAHGVAGRREDQLAALGRETRRLQVPEGVLRLEERRGVAAVDVRAPQRVDLAVLEVDDREHLAVRRDRRVGAVLEQPRALIRAQVDALDPVVVADVRAVLDDRRAPVHVEHVAGRVEARARVEDVVLLVEQQGFQIRAVEVHGVDV
jgi:hypothetical protein